MDFSFYLTYLWLELNTILCSSLLRSRRKWAGRDGNVKGKVLNLGAHRG